MTESEPSAPPEVVDDDVLRERLFHVIYHHDYQDGASGTTRDCRSLAASLAQFLVGQRTDLAAAIERAERAERERDQWIDAHSRAILGENTQHTRTSTDGQGPDYCAECSEAIQEWVKWPCIPADLDQARAQLAKVRMMAEALEGLAAIPTFRGRGVVAGFARDLRAALDPVGATEDEAKP